MTTESGSSDTGALQARRRGAPARRRDRGPARAPGPAHRGHGAAPDRRRPRRAPLRRAPRAALLRRPRDLHHPEPARGDGGGGSRRHVADRPHDDGRHEPPRRRSRARSAATWPSRPRRTWSTAPTAPSPPPARSPSSSPAFNSPVLACTVPRSWWSPDAKTREALAGDPRNSPLPRREPEKLPRTVAEAAWYGEGGGPSLGASWRVGGVARA